MFSLDPDNRCREMFVFFLCCVSLMLHPWMVSVFAAGEQTESEVSADPEACRLGLSFSVWALTQRRGRGWRRPDGSPAGCRRFRCQHGGREFGLSQWGSTSYWTEPALFLPAVHAGPECEVKHSGNGRGRDTDSGQTFTYHAAAQELSAHHGPGTESF